MSNNVYEAALAEYLEQATEDAEWKKLFRHSADQVLEELSSDERARLLEYMGRFSVPSAAFVAKELAAVSAVDLFTGREERSSDNLVRFHRNFILTQAGEEEGKQAADAPKAVMAAALRRQQGTVRVHRERVTESINATMEAFDESDRAKVETLFAGWPVAAVEFTIRIWMWLSDDHKRVKLSGAQFRRWQATGDERIWWQFFDVE